MGRRQKKQGGGRRSNKKVSKEDERAKEEEEEEEEVWDLIHVIPKSETYVCRTEGCENKAVACWASNLNPEDKWNMCEGCQQNDFGGWPEGVEPEATEEETPAKEEENTKDPGANEENRQRDQAKVVEKTSEANYPKDPNEQVETEVPTRPPSEESKQVEECVAEAQADSQSTGTTPKKEEEGMEREETPFEEPEELESPDENCPTLTPSISSDLAASGPDTGNAPVVSADNSVQDETRKESDENGSTNGSCDTPTVVETTENEDEAEDEDENEAEGGAKDEDENDEEEELWELIKIISHADLQKKSTIKCSTEECTLPACSVWTSNLDKKTKWYSCLDCQERDFDGWPPHEEFPADAKTLEYAHVQLIAAKCSKQKKPTLPDFRPTTNASRQEASPIPSHVTKDKAGTYLVTPPPNSAIKALAKQINVGNGGDVVAAPVAEVTPKPSAGSKAKKCMTPSAGALAMHKRWQEAAEALAGGKKDVRIVVSKPIAKKMIFDFMMEAFQPMNITQIYKGLKAIVPSPVLSACLQDMSMDKRFDKNPFADDDDDDDDESNGYGVAGSPNDDDNGNSSRSSEPYIGSLIFKAGRNQSSSVYFVNNNKLKGMDSEEREALAQDLAQARAEEEMLIDKIKSLNATTNQLASEPTNEQIAMDLESGSTTMTDLETKLGAARKLAVNEKHKVKTKRRIQNMATHWRKRKRLCMDFLISLEENTDGVISSRKCFAGDGQLVLDSDEGVVKAAIQYAKQKRERASQKTFKKRGHQAFKSGKAAKKSWNDELADETFVAVQLDSQHRVSRVYMDEE